MRLSIMQTTGDFDILGYTGLETILCDRPALVNAESAAIQSKLTLGQLAVVVAEVPDGLVSDEEFAELWAKVDGKDFLERTEMALLMFAEPSADDIKAAKKAEVKAAKDAAASVIS